MEMGVGCVNLGSASAAGSWSDHVRLVQTAIGGGVTVFDTADAYGAGSSERILGRAVRGQRDVVTISTKGGYLFRDRLAVEQRLRRTVHHVAARFLGPSGAGPSMHVSAGRVGYSAKSFTPAHLRRALEGSLRRLGTDHVDVYQLHGPPIGLDDLLAELHDLRTAGKVRRFGVGAESIAAALHWSGIAGVDVVQVPFGLLDPEAESAVFPIAIGSQVDIWARAVLGGGVLSAALADRAGVAQHPKIELIDRLLRVSAEAGIELDELAVRWVAGHPDVSVTLLGMSTMDHLRRNLAIASLPPLDSDVRTAVDAVLGARKSGDER